jgi:drug/metabolite transporter (DMT)-like permease
MLRTPRPVDLALFLLLSTIWSSSYLLTKLAVNTIPPFSLAALRCLIGGLVLAAILPFAGQAWPSGWSYWSRALGVTLFANGLPMALMAYGMARIDSGLGAIIIASAPLLTLAIAHLAMRDEPATPAKLMGMLIGFLGVVVLIGWEALGGLGHSLIGQAAMVGVALCYALASTTARSLKAPALANGAATLLLAAAQMLFVAALIEAPWTLRPSANSLVAIAILGMVNAAFATVIYFRLVAAVGATFVTLNNYVNPPLAVMWGALVLGEAVSLRAIASLLLIFIGISVANPDALRAIASRAFGGPRPAP